MIDVTSQLAVAVINRVGWSPERALDSARTISSQVRGDLDWDQDAGEEWVRVLLGVRVVALVSIVIPFGFILKASNANADFSASSLELVSVPDMDAPVLTCTPDALVAALGERTVSSPAVDVDGFSAEELWFATVS